jgi:phosphoribosylglycinamide formyltransferase 1
VPARLLVLASGSGSTLQAVLDAAGSPDFGATVVAAGTDRADCRAMTRAQAAGVPTFAVALAEHPSRDEWNDALAAAISEHRPDLVVLAGFMRILGPSVVKQFKILNTHPSLLPAFPGSHAIRDALSYGVKISGVTVHWVDEGLDTGPILAQAAVPVEAGDDEDSLRDRIQAIEKPLYVQTISQLSKRIDS